MNNQDAAFMKKNPLLKALTLFMILVCGSPVALNLQAQDRPPKNPPLLPFQTAPGDVNDEQLAMQFYQDKEYDKAADVYERIYEKKPSAFIYSYYLFCLIEIKEFDKAEKLVKTQRKSDHDALKYYVDQGYICYRRGDQDKARKQYEEALKKLGPDQQQVFDLAAAFLSHNENDLAIRVYEKGRQMIPNYPFSFEMASVYERTGDFKGMLDEYFLLIENNKTYLGTVEDRLQFALANDADNTKNEMFRKYLLEKAQKEPEKSMFSEMLWWYSVQQKDFSMALVQAKSIDRRLKEDGTRVSQLAKLCISNEDFENAIEAYRYLVSKGKDFPYYDESRMELINTRFLKTVAVSDPPRKQLEELEKEFHAEIRNSGENAGSVSLIRNLAHLDAFYLDKLDSAVDMLTRIIGFYDLTPLKKAECKLELGDIQVFQNDVWEATLTYQQVYEDFKHDMIGQEAKFRNSRLSFYIGEYKWALDQLNVLKAATSKLIANDAMALSLLISENMDEDSSTVGLTFYSRADLLEYRNQHDQAIITLDSVFKAFTDHPIFDDVIMKKAEIRVKEGKFMEADTLFGTLVKNYPASVLADDALMKRGRLNENQLGNKEKAMGYYEDLMKDYPGSIYVIEARKRFRNLRGDKGF
jgi:tetratricopeptide (TPR) repeat protein